MSERLRIEDVAWRVGGRDVLAGVSFAVAGGEFVACRAATAPARARCSTSSPDCAHPRAGL